MEEVYSIQDINLEAVLCYVDGQWAYFTTQSLEKQWGDDWDDGPFECNAGYPYAYCASRDDEPWKIYQLAYDAYLTLPDSGNDHYWSVKDINAKGIAWLQTPGWRLDTELAQEPEIAIYAGTTIKDFITLVHQAGGQVYLPIRNSNEL